NIRNVSYESDILMIGWLAIFTTSTILVIACQRKMSLPFKKTNIGVSGFSLNIIFMVLVLLALFHNVVFLTSGVSSKSEASLSGLNNLQFVHLWFITIYSIILVRRFLVSRKPSWKLIFS